MRTVVVEPETKESFTDDDILHITCCDDDIAYCGEDVSGHEWVTDGNLCALCEFIDEHNLPCPVQGCNPTKGWWK